MYRDGALLGLLDLQPVTCGHTLLIPMAHVARIADLAPDMGRDLFEAASQVSRALYDAMKCDGVNWFVADGEAAGQEVFHFHLHIIPRYEGDGFGLRFPPDYHDRPTRGALDEVAERVRESIGGG